MPPTAAEDPRRDPARSAVLAVLTSEAAGARRAFVDGTGTPVPLPAAIRRIVATDDAVGALLQELGAPLVGCAGTLAGPLAGLDPLGPARAPDPRAVAALRPDVIVTGVAGRAHDLADARLLAALRSVGSVVAVDVRRRAVAEADLRALLGVGLVEPPPREPARRRRPGR